jgi:hypothetical protein
MDLPIYFKTNFNEILAFNKKENDRLLGYEINTKSSWHLCSISIEILEHRIHECFYNKISEGDFCKMLLTGELDAH